MHIFAQKPKANQMTPPAKSATPRQMKLDQGHNVKSIFQLQRTMGNQTVQQIIQSNIRDVRGDYDTNGLPLPTGFLRKSGMDGRGSGSGEEEIVDEHGETTVPATGSPLASGATRPTPVNVRNGPRHAVINSGNRVGMSIAIAITSSSGRDADMAAIQDSEQVGLSFNHTGSMRGVSPLPSSTSSWMRGHPIPDDQHSWSKAAIIDRVDNHGGGGGFEKQQLDIRKDPAGASPRQGRYQDLVISSNALLQRSGRSITFRTEKRAAAALVNGYTSAAGPSPTYAKEVVVR